MKTITENDEQRPVDSSVKTHLLGVLNELYPSEPLSNLFVRQTKNLDYEIGYTNDYQMQHGDGVKFILPNDVVNYILKLRFGNNVGEFGNPTLHQ